MPLEDASRPAALIGSVTPNRCRVVFVHWPGQIGRGYYRAFLVPRPPEYLIVADCRSQPAKSREASAEPA